MFFIGNIGVLDEFSYWEFLPLHIQQLILSYFKFDAETIFILMKVSKSFKKHVEVIHSQILDVSLGLCSKKHWSNKVLPLYKDLLYSIDLFSNLFNEADILNLMIDGSIFRAFLHFFLCERYCDDVKSYCSLCSHVRPRIFSNLTLFDDVYLETRDFRSQLGIDDDAVDFSVFLKESMLDKTDSSIDGFCLIEMPIHHPSDLYVMFVSIFIRINLNLCYNFFLNKKKPIMTEIYYIRKIEEFVRDLASQIWYLNVNYFYIIFQKFESLNRSICFYITNLNLIEDLKRKSRAKYYLSKLPVVSLSSSSSDDPINLDSSDETK